MDSAKSDPRKMTIRDAEFEEENPTGQRADKRPAIHLEKMFSLPSLSATNLVAAGQAVTKKNILLLARAGTLPSQFTDPPTEIRLKV